MIYSKIISSLEKFFPTNKLSDFPEHKELSALKEETRHGFDEVNQRLHDVMNAIQNKPKSFWDRIPLLKDIPTWFWIILWI